MIKRTLFLFFFIFSLFVFAQNQLKPIEELLNSKDNYWETIVSWSKNSKNKVAILPAKLDSAKVALFKTQVSNNSTMGSVIFNSGGILIENGLIRILGSGSAKLKRNLPEWNKNKSFVNYGEKPDFILIADDAIGGFFLINGGKFGDDLGKVYYFSPDSLEFEPLNLTYTDFVQFCFNGNLEKFYKDLLWKNWEKEVSNLSTDSVFNFYPFLWTKEGKNVNKDLRKIVPIEEQYIFNIDKRKELGL
ncbi:DUF2625 domain-containing protein [Halpernia sp. GG3]